MGEGVVRFPVAHEAYLEAVSVTESATVARNVERGRAAFDVQRSKTRTASCDSVSGCESLGRRFEREGLTLRPSRTRLARLLAGFLRRCVSSRSGGPPSPPDDAVGRHGAEHPKCRHPPAAGTRSRPVFHGPSFRSGHDPPSGRGVIRLDYPTVRAMRTALVPPNAKEFDITARGAFTARASRAT